MSPAPRIAVVGSANIDLMTFTDQFPAPGETIFGQDFDLGFGGKGANQAVAARLCGAQVVDGGPRRRGSLRARDDQELRVTADRYEPCARCVEGVSSGVAPIFVEPNGQNRIWVVKGANDKLLPADVDEAAPMLKQADCIILQFEIPLETVYYTMRFASANGIKCILNPAPGQPVDLDEVTNVDYFVPNESEAETISGMPVKSIDEAKACAKYFLDSGHPARDHHARGQRARCWPATERMELIPAVHGANEGHHRRGRRVHRQLRHVPWRGLPEKEAISQACLYASLSTTNVGTQKSFLKRGSSRTSRKARR